MTPPDTDRIKDYFREKLTLYGTTPRGVDWNSPAAQETRFEQLLRVIDLAQPFSILDYGCGFGSLASFLRQKDLGFQYIGYDILPEMIAQAQELYAGKPGLEFTCQEETLKPVDYAVESGIFNIQVEDETSVWTEFVIATLHKMDRLSLKGFSFNLLTSYSDADYMKPHLYYADPCFFFDYCKRHFSRNVALLHDYNLYDFTILVRKTTS
jgi:SAM-dependent methyltransferase